MAVVLVDERGRICIPKDMRVDAEKAVIIPLGNSYMVIPIPKSTPSFSITESRELIKERAEKALKQEIRQRMQRRGQRSS